MSVLTVVYVDTSAPGALLVAQAETMDLVTGLIARMPDSQRS